MSKLKTYRTPGYDDEPPRSPQLSTDDDDDTVMHPRDVDESFAVLEASRIPKPDRNSISKHVGEVAALKPSILHCWPLLFGLLYLAGAGFGVSKLVKAGWIDPEFGNATYAQYREDSVLGESCRGVDHAVPWRELKRKLKRCRRHEYYVRQLSYSICHGWRPHLCFLQDPMHDDCHLCPAAAPEDKIFAVFWETQKDCTRPLDDGTINTKLQFWDDEHIRDCIGQLRMFVVILLLSFVHHPRASVDGGVGLDAVQRPDEPRYLLSWDEFPYAWDPPQPDNANYKGCIRYTEGEDGWHRCYEPRISNLVDFVNVMFYNINGGEVRSYHQHRS
ncbi:hypothetical protein DYB26_013263 [Aphanomyces astaci]|uniref:GH18 domain-containing protein n=1 Tax=Aphanomyces astaci TaxID=112090 RepID=A0A3R7BRE9_APHAT|nr:hypothetical protein DYB26_013263 [Aphanomyces astaci]